MNKWWLERLLLRPYTALLLLRRVRGAQKLRQPLPCTGFGLIQKIAKHTQHVYARCGDGSLSG